jgi:hypothetical protein
VNSVDKFGNIRCVDGCGEIHSPSFAHCPSCCPHEALSMDSAWVGNDDGGQWHYEAVCDRCGKDYFHVDEIVGKYRLTKA